MYAEAPSNPIPTTTLYFMKNGSVMTILFACRSNFMRLLGATRSNTPNTNAMMPMSSIIIIICL